MLCLFSVRSVYFFFKHCIYLLLIDTAISKLVFKASVFAYTSRFQNVCILLGCYEQYPCCLVQSLIKIWRKSIFFFFFFYVQVNSRNNVLDLSINLTMVILRVLGGKSKEKKGRIKVKSRKSTPEQLIIKHEYIE